MSATGVVFDIKQLSVFDGPGIRTTVFFKGCPLRCSWCHNPEGLSYEPQLMASANGCTNCGKCHAVCPHPAACQSCGACVKVCPLGLRRICGTRWAADTLAEQLLRDAGYLILNGGGYTLSGGEPTGQPSFMLGLLQRLAGNHRAVETCGFCSAEVFSALLQNVELVLLDIKHADPLAHRMHTKQSNAPILRNLKTLKESGVPFTVRIPVIPGVNDSAGNFTATAKLLAGATALTGVELMPYHKTAGAKYGMVGKQYAPSFDEDASPNLQPDIFLEHGIACEVL